MKTIWIVISGLAYAIICIFVGHKWGKQIATKAHELKDKLHSKDEKKDK